jgi:aerobic-type carbon monoxide dehydrogenase small subunit (CoxS/CutS family)
VIVFTLNGAAVDVDAPAEMPLLWVLRDKLGLTGTKYGCGIAQCGACTVQLDGVAVRSCVVPVSAAAGREVRTVEALASATGLAAVQQAWIDEQVPQCGYCQSGMLMTVDALLSQNPDPDDALIDSVVTNICRCGTYPRIRRAIHRAALIRRNST